jgi:hypothetical protein
LVPCWQYPHLRYTLQIFEFLTKGWTSKSLTFQKRLEGIFIVTYFIAIAAIAAARK